MRNVYFAMEAIGALTILILLYGNIFEIKRHTKKHSIFTKLLLVNLCVVVVDAITWMDYNWQQKQGVFWTLIMLTYVLPAYMTAVFSSYLYEHISDKGEVSKKPFAVLRYFAIALCMVTFFLCLSGKVFVIQQGVFYSAEWEKIYYLLYLLSLLFFAGVIISNQKKLGLHDLTAMLSFCLLPFLAMLISLTDLGMNLVIPSLALEMLLIYVMLQADTESRLLYQSNNDELTGLLNRRAYEDDMLQYSNGSPKGDFVYASIDLNSLKQVNDTLGHCAGDELICGAAYCLKHTFDSCGKVYRIGGDEFVAIFFADEQHRKRLMEDLKKIAEEWHGTIVDSVSLSVGYASEKEFNTGSVKELSKIAEKRMYEDKARYYATKGVDRRGQNEAHKVLCALYTKILKINITDDTFSIVNMDEEEQTDAKGYSQSISQWLIGFGKSGCVHPEDLDTYLAKTDLEYMRSYFKSKKTSLIVLYRRKFKTVYKQVMMELIPAKDYSDENQSLFLYVKNIDP